MLEIKIPLNIPSDMFSNMFERRFICILVMAALRKNFKVAGIVFIIADDDIKETVYTHFRI